MIEAYRFGSYIIDGQEYRWDIKIFNKRVVPWEGREGHNIFVKDIEDILERKPAYIVIGTGASGLVKVDDEVKKIAEENNIRLIIEKTPVAVEEFNRLQKEGKDVCAIMHGTC